VCFVLLQGSNVKDEFLTRVTQLVTCLWFNTCNFPKTEVGSEKFIAPVQTLENLEMKKTLIAIAALAATSAFAQSSVVLSGNLDFAASNVSGTQIGSNANTFATTTGTSSTSVIRLTAVEDLGNGTKATVSYGLDPRTLSNDALSNTGAQAVGSSGAFANVTTGLSRDAVFVGIEGKMGNLRLGSPNSLGLEAHFDSAPLGTGSGSGFAGNAGTMMNSVVNVRYNRSARYDSPAFSGFSASVLVAPGGDLAQVDTQAATQTPNSRATTEAALKYSNGPLKVSLTGIMQDAQSNKTGYYSGAQAAAAVPEKTSNTLLAANYKIGNTTLYAGMNTGDRLAAQSSASGLAVESKGQRFAIKHTMGKIDLYASQTTQEVKGTASAATDVKSTVNGFGADYNFSKTTAVYGRYEEWKTGMAAAAGTAGATAGATGDRTTVSVGLRKSF
jgi:predicted porin